MKNYLAFTIGPIYDTIKQARKTRELWACSYIFSVLMRMLIKEAKKQNLGTLIAPIISIPEDEISNGAGIYPDRCFFKIEKEPEKLPIAEIIEKAIEQVAIVLAGKTPGHLKLVRHFRVFAAQVKLADKSKESPILQLNNILDGVELQPLVPQGDKRIVAILEKNIQNLYDDALFEKEEDSNDIREKQKSVFIRFNADQQRRLPSLIELTTSELSDLTYQDEEGKEVSYQDIITEPTNEAVLEYQRLGKNASLNKKLAQLETATQEEAIAQLKALPNKAFKFRHKYVCFVIADGDSVGKTIGAIGNNLASIGEFSELLGDFAQAAVDKIVDFDGLPVYAGGDDLLFLAPLQNKKGKHIFDLVEELDKLFPGSQLEALGKAANCEFNAKPSLSYGLSISYYKYPMFESLETMEELLFKDAKSFKGKNTVAFRVLKHSGQAFGSTIGKSRASFQAFRKILKLCRKQDTSFLTSVMHKLYALRPLLEDALKNTQTQSFFKHHFNEPIHAEVSTDQYIQQVRLLCEALWMEASADNKANAKIESVTEQVYAVLRFIQFLNQEDHE